MKRGTIGEQLYVLGLLLLTALFLVRGAVLADTRPGKHTHQHDSWEPPPPE
jgi:hypothetical protein